MPIIKKVACVKAVNKEKSSITNVQVNYKEDR